MLIKVKVSPGNKRQEVIEKKSDEFEVLLKSKPVLGAANKEMVMLLANFFKIKTSQLRIIKGKKSRNKIIEINAPKNK